MHDIALDGCTSRPLGAYLKALAVLRLVAEQADGQVRGWWTGDRFHLCTTLTAEDLVAFFLNSYRPTPILAPWNGGSGFYPKDRTVGLEAILKSEGPRFAEYRDAIAILRALPEVTRGKAEKAEEEERRTGILLQARNRLPDSAVEWLDAAVGISTEGKRSFAPVLGTGGNEGRLDYTNNFMERLAGLLIHPAPKAPVRSLLENALFARPCDALQPAAAGQFDPGRAGGFNQSQGIESPDVPINPWVFVLTLEGAVAWAAGIYRRQGVSYRSFLCSPFTVSASSVGYNSSSASDDARAELWAPLWNRPASYPELKVLVREGRAAVGREPARTGLQLAEAAASLGVDRGIQAFVRYNLLKRRGDSYVALPTGVFNVEFRSISDRIRELGPILDRLDWIKFPPAAGGLRRAIDAAMFQALLHGKPEHLRAVMGALGRLLRWVGRSGQEFQPKACLNPASWIDACGASEEVRIAAALSSFYPPWLIRHNLFAPDSVWAGQNLPERMTAVLERRIRDTQSADSRANPLAAAWLLHPGDATVFIEGSVDDELIEDLLFAFTCLDWKQGPVDGPGSTGELLPVYAALKYLFHPSPLKVAGERVRLPPDLRIVPLLRAGRLKDAAAIAEHRLRVAGLNPVRAGQVMLYGASFSPKHPADCLERGLYLLSESRKVDG
ncbi:MAG: type I-U CRISPR-associated protein Csx17, partial [Acidobacteria bacterium]|nr:type I-U CRISPR-associated protein Csx17 [Acidobacteriota bacterium]